jgi:tetratricopeptide (TPR) repeat protein
VCATAVALCVRWRRTPAAFFIAFFFAALAPVSNLIVLIGSIMAERFMYLPSVGLAGCAVVIIRTVSRRFWSMHPITGEALPAAVGLVCLTLAARTYARNLDWHDDLTLWTSTLSSYPESARAHNNLGNALSLVPGQLPHAIAELETALRIRPDYAEAHYNLGNAFAHTPGRLNEAIDEFRAALRFKPDFGKLQHDANTHVNLGNVLARADQLSEAIAEYQAAIRVRPYLAEAHYDLGNVLARMPGQVEQAIGEFRIAVQIQPDLAEAHYSLGSVLLRMPGHAPDAIMEFETVLRIRPDPQLQRFVDQLHGATRN